MEKFKKVAFIELFYDLVFVYGLSQATNLFLHEQSPGVMGRDFLTFIVVIVVFINTWIVQMVFNNRFGKSSANGIMFSLVGMVILLYMGNAFTGDLTVWFKPFAIATALLTFTLLLQYGKIFFGHYSAQQKKIAHGFVINLSFRTLTIGIAAFLPLPFGVPLAVFGVLLSSLAPAWFGNRMREVPVDFHHVVERLTLLTIMTFGEMIVGIAPYFTSKKFSIFSIGIFVIVAGLFIVYTTQFNHLLDTHHPQESGLRLIYLHYLIFFSLSSITVAITLFSLKNASFVFALTMLYAGLFLFFVGVFLTMIYNKEAFQYSKTFMATYLGVLALFYGLLLFHPTFKFIISVSAGLILLLSVLFSRKFIKELD